MSNRRALLSSAAVLICAALAIESFSPVNAATPEDAIARAVANPHRSDADRLRDVASKPAAVLSFMGLRPNMKVADVMSGGGYWSELMSYVVLPKGSVVAHTVSAYDKQSADERRMRFAQGRLPNVIPLTAELADLRLGKEPLDLVLMSLVYHDIYFSSEEWPPVNRDEFFARIRSALKPGGILVVIDHAAKAGSGNTAAQKLHRIDEVFARSDIERAGFEFKAQSAVLRNPADDHALISYDPAIRGHTDRFVYRFIKR